MVRVKPPALPERATIAVVAPGSAPQTRSDIEQATAYFEARGHRVLFGPNHRNVHGYLAGTDEERAADLQWALSEPGIDMVHTLCGGYGSARLYDLIDWGAVGEPRIVCGFSDITALHLALAAQTGWLTFYGPNFLRFTRHRKGLTAETRDWFHRAFEPEPLGRLFEDPENPYVLTVGEGEAEAPLVGGCLTLLAASVGTPYEVQTDGCVVMAEDLNTEPYLIDTALNHLIRAGKLDRAAGFVFGTDVNLRSQTVPEAPESTLSIEEMLDELIGPLGIPAIANVPVGHGKHMATMPLGATVRLDGGAKTLEVLEAAVEPRMDNRGNGGSVMRLRRISTAVSRSRRRSRWRSPYPAPRRRRTPPAASVLRIGWAQDAPTLNPFIGLDEEDYNVWAMNWDLLVNFDPKDLSPAPGIAQSWDVSDDKKTVTFKLDPGREVVGRQADHLRGRQVLARGARRQRRPVHQLHRQRRPRSTRPDPTTVVDPHPAGRTRGSSAACSSTSSRSTSGARCRSRTSPGTYKPDLPLVGSGPYIVTEFERGKIIRRWSGTRTSAARSRPSTRSSSSSTATRTRSSGRCSSARSTWCVEVSVEQLRPPRRRAQHRHGRERRRPSYTELAFNLCPRGQCPDAAVQPRGPGPGRAPGDRLRGRPRADQHDRRPRHLVPRPRDPARVLQVLLRAARAGLSARPGDGATRSSTTPAG